VPAKPDSTATITFTPDTSGGQYMLVWAVAPDGTVSDNYNFYFFVAGS
jgi:hypothetical protein